MRAFSAAAVGLPVSHCSVGSVTSSCSIAMAGIDAPKTASAAADTKAFRDWGSACKAVDAFGVDAVGAKPEVTAMMERAAMTESFMVDLTVSND